MSGPLDVAIHLSATNGVSSVLAVIAKDVLGLHGSMQKLNKEFAALKPAVIGAAAVLGGSKMLGGVKDLVDRGNELVKIQRDMGAAGVSNLQVQQAYAQAWKLTGQYQNLSAVEILKLQNEARQTFGDQNKATSEIAPFAEAMSFLKSYEGGKHGGGSNLLTELNAAMKSGEIAGKINPEDMKEHVKQLVGMKVAYGEGLSIQNYLAAQRTGGAALRNTSDEFRYGMFPAMVQELGAGAGVMIMTAFNKVVAGVGNRTNSLQRMNEIGLLNQDQLKYDKVGRVIGLKDPDGIKGSQEAAMNFGSWVMTTLKPLLDKQTAGLDPQKASIRESQLISGMFPDRNASKAIVEIIQQFTKFQKNAELQSQAVKTYDANAYNKGSWDYQVQAFTTQWNNLQQALGAPAVATATKALASMNSVVTSMSQWTSANPDAAKAMVGTLTTLGTALVAFGTVMVGGAVAAAIGFVGPVAAGIAVVAGGITALATAIGFVKPDALKSVVSYIAKLGGEMVEGMKQAFAGFAKFDAAAVISGIARVFNAQMLGLPGLVAGAIASAVAGIGTAIANAIKGAISGATHYEPAPGDTYHGRGSQPQGQWPHGRSGMAAPLAPSGKMASLTAHHTVVLDGRAVAQSTSRHLVAMAEHPSSIGATDSYGHHMGPGTDLPAWG